MGTVTNELEKPKKIKGLYEPYGEWIYFKDTWGSHKFTVDELQSLLKGKEISFLATSSVGLSYVATGKLEKREYEGHEYWGFNVNMESKNDEKRVQKFASSKSKVFEGKEKIQGVYTPTSEMISFSRVWGGYRFTKEDCRKLLNGLSIFFKAKTSTGKEYVVQGKLEKQEFNGSTFWGFKKSDETFPAEWASHKFTKEELKILMKGGTVFIPDAVSSKTNKNFFATVYVGEVDGRKKIIPIMA